MRTVRPKVQRINTRAAQRRLTCLRRRMYMARLHQEFRAEPRYMRLMGFETWCWWRLAMQQLWVVAPLMYEMDLAISQGRSQKR